MNRWPCKKRVVAESPLWMQGGLFWQAGYNLGHKYYKCWSLSSPRQAHSWKCSSTWHCEGSSPREGQARSRNCRSVFCTSRRRWGYGSSRSRWLLGCRSMHPWQHCRPAITTNINSSPWHSSLCVYWIFGLLFHKEEHRQVCEGRGHLCLKETSFYTVKRQSRINYVEAFFPEIYFTRKRIFNLF